MEINKESASDFIGRNSVKVGELTKINVNSALLELYARFKNAQEQIKEIQTCLSYIPELEERISKLEGLKKIEIISPDQANRILKG